jgi:hypothetical protein
MTKEIKIKCKVADGMALDELYEFQGELKTISDDELEKLKKSILKYGFSFPVFVWENKILDGHQRMKAVKQLVEQGCKIKDNKLPVVRIEAKNEKEAAEKLLLINSRYAKIDQEGFQVFTFDFDIDIPEIGNFIDIPEIVIGELDDDAVDPNAEWDGMPEFNQEDDVPYKSLIVHFENEDYFKDFCNLIKQVVSDDAKYIYHPKKIRDDVKSVAYKNES